MNSSGIALAFNIPALLGTILSFFCFWIYFFYFSKKIETILIRNFGDNLRNLYWVRKGKRFFNTLFRVMGITFLCDLALYTIFFVMYFRNDSEMKSDQGWIMTIYFLIVVVWLYLVNISSYTIFFISQRQKYSEISIDYEILNEFHNMSSYRFKDNKAQYWLNKKMDWKIKQFKNKTKGMKRNQTIKYSLVLIETYALITNNSKINKSVDNEKYLFNSGTNTYISKKELVIEINRLFNEGIHIHNVMN